MLSLLAVGAVALAHGNPDPALVWPGAAPASAGTGDVSAGAFALFGDDDPLAAAAGVACSLHDRIGVGAHVVALGYGDDPVAGLLGEASVRGIALDLDRIHLGGFALALFGRGSDGEWMFLPLGGIAFDAAGREERVRFDASIPFGASAVATGQAVSGPAVIGFPVWLLAEAGVSIAMNGRNTLRVGTLSILPNLTWRYHPNRFSLEVTGGFLGYVAVRAGFDVGAETTRLAR